MAPSLDDLAALTSGVAQAHRGLPAAETVASWDPPLSGDIAIRVRRDGTWEHEGSEIRRESIWRLFAALLRREDDGAYYLVTPVEKWRIAVEGHPLLVIDFERRAGDDGASLWLACLNNGAVRALNDAAALHVPPDAPEPWLALPNGLSAQVSRAAWYRLIESAVEEGGKLWLRSGATTLLIGATGHS